MSEIKIEVLSRKAPRARKFKFRQIDRIEQAQRKQSAFASAAELAWWLVKPRRASWALVSLTAVVVMFGTPHVLVTYQCLWRGTPGQYCTACRYFGVQGMRGHVGRDGNCPLIAMLPVNWAALQKQFFTRRSL